MDWREQHGKIIKDFLEFMNKETSNYILKGGTCLAQCYNLDRFSEDIDLDGKGNQIIDICKKFAEKYGFECREAKNTDTVKRCMIHYGGIKPLKIEMSARRVHIPEEEVTTINGIRAYVIDTMAMLKTSAYQQRDKIRDLYDVTFIINNYYDQLSSSTKALMQNALQYKGLEHFDYIISNQKDELINIDILAENFLKAYEKVGLLLDKENISKNIDIPNSNTSQQMEQTWTDFFNKPKDERISIEWNGKNYRIAEFEDMYLAQCKKDGVMPNNNIKEHFWKNCVDRQGYEPKFCKNPDISR